MLQYNGKLEESITYYTEALDITIKVHGNDHFDTANIYHHISLAYSMTGNYREALKMEQKNFEILSNLTGGNDKRVIESSAWLKQLTKYALSEAKKKIWKLRKEKFNKI